MLRYWKIWCWSVARVGAELLEDRVVEYWKTWCWSVATVGARVLQEAVRGAANVVLDCCNSVYWSAATHNVGVLQDALLEHYKRLPGSAGKAQSD